ncbi:MAG: DUF4465 domain-containing protein [Prevotellaceae bacterium]|jgi:hypothetical protein|nr:DUF4465 domain-containing protein [Prevotellaceae bacterium]
MKKFFTILNIALTAMMFVSCNPEEPQKQPTIKTIDFESVELNSDGYQNNFADGLILSDVDFYNSYNAGWDAWEGFSVSNNTDKIVAGLANQYSVYAASGANGSQKFAVIGAGYSETSNCKFIDGKELKFKGLYINNSTFAYLAVKDGNDGTGYVKGAFEAGDWFKIIITAFNAAGGKIGEKEFYLADFRDSKSFVCSDWTFVDLSSLGKVNKLEFTFASTDTGDHGMNTPAYVCVDNVSYEAE